RDVAWHWDDTRRLAQISELRHHAVHFPPRNRRSDRTDDDPEPPIIPGCFQKDLMNPTANTATPFSSLRVDASNRHSQIRGRWVRSPRGWLAGTPSAPLG